MLYAIDKHTGQDRVGADRVRGRAAQQAAHQVHLRQRLARHRRPHRRRLVRLAGRARLRRERHALWNVDLGRVDMGAYDIPSYEWGPASSPIIWNGLVLLQCDTQTDSSCSRSTRDRRRRCGRPRARSCRRGARRRVVTTRPGRARDQRGELHPRLRSAHRRGAVAAWRQLQDHRADSDLRQRPDHRGERAAAGTADLRGASGARAISRSGRTRPAAPRSPGARPARGSYMPTPLAYDGILYVLHNNGVFDAYEVEDREGNLPAAAAIRSAADSARRRLRPTARSICRMKTARCWSSRPGASFSQIATNTMGELLMATPALSDGVMYVRSSSSLFAIGNRRQ